MLLIYMITGAASDRKVFDLQHVERRVHGSTLQACKYQTCHHFYRYLIN